MPTHFDRRNTAFNALALFVMFVLANSSTLQLQEPSPKASAPFRRMDRNKDGQLTKDEFPGPLFDKIDAPFLFIPGTNDRLVPFNQSELLSAALAKVGVEAALVPVIGGGHGNLQSPEVPRRIQAFFDWHLRGADVVISGEPISL